MDFNDRRNTVGAGDFNNPKGTFQLVTHGHAETDRWSGLSHAEAKNEVHAYYADQKDTKTWGEATRLAKQRTDHEARKWGFDNGAQYADSYQEHLARVMATKGPAIAEQYGELHHRQAGYGRV